MGTNEIWFVYNTIKLYFCHQKLFLLSIYHITRKQKKVIWYELNSSILNKKRYPIALEEYWIDYKNGKKLIKYSFSFSCRKQFCRCRDSPERQQQQSEYK